MNILAITYWSYKDALIQTYTLPYLKIMQKYRPEYSWIYLFTLEQKHLKITQQEQEIIDKKLARFRIKLMPYKYHSFGLKAIGFWLKTIIELVSFTLRYNVDHLHCFCTDAIAAGYIISKATGIPLIADSYEPHAEPMLESKTWTKNSLAFKTLFAFEKLQSHHAKAFIACVAKMREYAKEKYNASIDCFYVKPACVDLVLFSEAKIKDKALLKQLELEDKIVLLYAGKFGGSYMHEEVFDFIKVAETFYGDELRVLLLGKHKDEDLRNQCNRVGLARKIILDLFVPHERVADYMGLADFAITPFIPVPSKRYGSPIKNGEYWAMGLPVVIPPNISDDSMIIEENNVGAIISALDEACYLNAIKKIDQILKEDDVKRRKRIREIAIKYRSFEIADKVYKDIYA